jgi:hypothetical protein
MFCRIAFLTITVFLTAGLSAQEITLKQTDTGYEVRIGDLLFAGYITDYEGAPIVYPIVGPAGKSMTRDYPMKKGYEPIQADHPHQRSLWFSHGDINGLDFWATLAKPLAARHKIIHKRFVKAECDGKTALLVAEDDWTGNDQLICRDVRTLRFSTSGEMRIIDFDITMTAEQEKVVLGDTKEGTFGIRVPEVLAVDEKKGGRIINAEGAVNEDAWGKRSAWVDYHGIIDGEKVGIAVMNHPSSFRYPTYWHVRTYGLFAANPFGVHDFDKSQGTKAGEYILPKGESFTLRYRLVFHKGDEAGIADAFKEYAEMPDLDTFNPYSDE